MIKLCNLLSLSDSLMLSLASSPSEGGDPLPRFQAPPNFGNDWLTRLHEVALPDTVSVWPLAPGWWLLGFLVLWGLLGVLHWRYQHWQRDAYRRQALQQIEACRRACATGDLSSLQQLPTLLKRVALHSLQLAGQSRTQVTALTGEPWLRWLSQVAPIPMPDNVRQLSELAYAPASRWQSLPDGECQALLDWCAQWVSEHRIEETGV